MMHHGQNNGKENNVNFTKIGGIKNFAKIGGICNMHHWLRGMDAPDYGFKRTTSEYRNRNLKTSNALLKSQAQQGTSLFRSAATNQRGVFKRVVKRSSGQISRWPEGGTE